MFVIFSLIRAVMIYLAIQAFSLDKKSQRVENIILAVVGGFIDILIMMFLFTVRNKEYYGAFYFFWPFAIILLGKLYTNYKRKR